MIRKAEVTALEETQVKAKFAMRQISELAVWPEVERPAKYHGCFQ